jgi:hypothetical protein
LTMELPKVVIMWRRPRLTFHCTHRVSVGLSCCPYLRYRFG